eukprot:SAG11_NODE_23905_length_381_cov_1.095745_1_plen_68_part_10
MLNGVHTEVWTGMTPTLAHPELAQNVWHRNDQAFVQEIPDFNAVDGCFMRWRGEFNVAAAGDCGVQTR